MMTVIVVTRLRLKDPALLDEFFTQPSAAHRTREFPAPVVPPAGG